LRSKNETGQLVHMNGNELPKAHYQPSSNNIVGGCGLCVLNERSSNKQNVRGREREREMREGNHTIEQTDKWITMHPTSSKGQSHMPKKSSTRARSRVLRTFISTNNFSMRTSSAWTVYVHVMYMLLCDRNQSKKAHRQTASHSEFELAPSCTILYHPVLCALCAANMADALVLSCLSCLSSLRLLCWKTWPYYEVTQTHSHTLTAWTRHAVAAVVDLSQRGQCVIGPRCIRSLLVCSRLHIAGGGCVCLYVYVYVYVCVCCDCVVLEFDETAWRTGKRAAAKAPKEDPCK